jgi:hypothetical protein
MRRPLAVNRQPPAEGFTQQFYTRGALSSIRLVILSKAKDLCISSARCIGPFDFAQGKLFGPPKLGPQDDNRVVARASARYSRSLQLGPTPIST